MSRAKWKRGDEPNRSQFTIAAKVTQKQKKWMRDTASDRGCSEAELVYQAVFSAVPLVSPHLASAREHLTLCHVLKRAASIGEPIDPAKLDRLIELATKLVRQSRQEASQ